ncbi:GNAT family N-acetyltransferase [Geodermatophilus amargosae]|uniref:GNAT family N-acetyltransferase n=1 Tax=Geodermatophilus amargosae TaxID=1296565 RepID=UPI0034DE321F
MTASGAAPARLWYARHAAPDGGAVVVGVLGGQFPADAVVDLPWPAAYPAGWHTEAHVAAPGRVPHRVGLSPEVAAGAPLLWLVLLHGGDGDQVDLVAFSTPHHPGGTVVGQASFEALGVSWSDQVGAVRWSPSTGLVAQVYVAPQHRRKGVARTLLPLVDAVRSAMDWAPLVSDGRMTDLGAALLAARPEHWRARAPRRTADLPPMTPPEDAVGVPERNLVPAPS